jgi:hypothetical protein
MIRRNRGDAVVVIGAFIGVPSGWCPALAEDPPFDKIVDDYFETRFSIRPSEGTAAGLHQ